VHGGQKFGVKAWGFDIDPRAHQGFAQNRGAVQVKDLVTIKQQDIFEMDLSKADVIRFNLLPQLNVKLIPQLDKLKPGCRIVSHDFNMEGVRPSAKSPSPQRRAGTPRVFMDHALEKERK